ncbi:hypothetical protein Agabi119p4_2775 [Agaricus bisporus var. burnettii]|uniref:Peroxin-3 n=1 Tax=Agaricus bisporus var. burnettii TaxID=192524 RepID=A0A8H7KIA4_AGABI|nr:hypothetical protein Agabi119p4_2775 [Agaricus bisporus var. burnettii]
MFSTLRNYVVDRKSGIAKTVGFAGGLYIAKNYIGDRLEEVKVRLEQERTAKDSLRRRFQQTQDDVSYTVMALLPTLGDQILEYMDVEAITKELQSRSKIRNARQQSQALSSLASSIDVVQEHDVRSDSGSIAPSVASTGFSFGDPDSTAATAPQVVSQPSESARDHLSSSVVASSTSSAISGENLSLHSSQLSDPLTTSSAVSESSDTRTKVELWNEVKMLTFTRTLTALYSTTLLCLLTAVQLTLLARAKYVHSVLQQGREEQVQERLEAELSLTKLMFGGMGRLEELMSRDLEALMEEEDALSDEAMSEDVENKYLTMSWWLLHVGWKDVGERVRRGVEEVFEGVSLKTKLSAMDLHRLVRDVRRRVEYEITFEGTERRINFLSTLLPPTPEMVQHVLSQGGFSGYNEPSSPSLGDRHTQESSTSLSSSQLSHSNYFLSALNNTADPFNTFAPFGGPAIGGPLASSSQVAALPSDNAQTLPIPNPHPHTEDLPFTSLLDETRSIICSSDFAFVLENCLDRGVEVLFDGLEKNVFVDSSTGPEEEVRIRLAGMLPGLSRWSSLALRSIPCELVDNVLAVRDVSCLSAIVFSKFEEKFQ